MATEIAGKDYAQAGMTDFTTAAGMRFAMFDTVEKWQKLAPAEQTKANAIRMVGEASRNNDLLKAAGTQEIVARFYESLFEGKLISKDPNFKGTLDPVAYLNAINPENVRNTRQFIDEQKGDINKWGVAWTMATSPLRKAISNVSSALEEHLGMGAATTALIGDLKANPKLTQGVMIAPKQLTPEQAKLVASFDGMFRSLDALDGKIPVFGSPEVQHLLGPPPKAALLQLDEGKSWGVLTARSMDFDRSKIPPVIAQIMNAGFAEQVAKQLAVQAGIPALPAGGAASVAIPARPASAAQR